MFSLYGGAPAPQLFQVDPNGQGLQQCTIFEPGDSEPMWTYDGSRVVFSRDGGLVVRDEESGQAKVIRPNAPAPAIQWAIAPDGQRVAYACQETGSAGFEVFVVDLNDESKRKLELVSNPIIDDHEVDNRYVSWSPWLWPGLTRPRRRLRRGECIWR
jgi:Tol biopolymer transport system component